jgi:hypothetical protein
MALYGTNRDISFFRHINLELINNIIEQQVGYYKISLEKTNSNIYGESPNKIYNNPVLVNCLIERSNQEWKEIDMGSDTTRSITVRFLRDILVNINLVPEVGDIILWNDDYYELSNIVENQLITGKNPGFSYSSDNDDRGSSWSILVKADYIRPEKVGLNRTR